MFCLFLVILHFLILFIRNLIMLCCLFQAVCENYDCRIDNFDSLVDGKAIWCLLDYYFRKELHNSCLLKVVNLILHEITVKTSLYRISSLVFSPTGSQYEKWQGINNVYQRLFRCSIQFYSISEVNNTIRKLSGGKYPKQ